ncbi:hypothetical protein TVAG_441370 [Trichomonas vaginalis G3]|uniref:Uncharacterized protein n=1 Tax=Trichomonas vaginalis (strain ATCC PRA-98 / G3) TaxID=412133 RepID=A2FF93_TRIV3|nr:hypothetical protein TVAGG3_0878720 [Trichomonas vaginalis G3]EAX96423.1 hypothetical protein TVAG_441370 [Trichomonas vaginalis G3]KAI5501885.1 hypothetical protein TVAGG3_0878720 [Trichomonas vaginalis G3]|eukprot:XP_001309353.1 hypothetical protein [Trichomonas vaginalis G3]
MFQSKELVTKFFSRFYRVRKNIETSVFEFPKFILQIKDSSNNFSTEEGVFSVDDISFDSTNFIKSSSYRSVVVDAESPNRTSEYPFAIKFSASGEKDVHETLFSSDSELILGFLTLYIAILKKNSQKEEPLTEDSFAKELPKQNEDFIFGETKFISPELNQRMEISQNTVSLKFSPVIVPEKASLKRELISFGLPIKRRIFYINSSRRMRTPLFMKKIKPQFNSIINSQDSSRYQKTYTDDMILKYPEINLPPTKSTSFKFNIAGPLINEFLQTNSSPTSMMQSLQLASQQDSCPPDIKMLFDKLKITIPSKTSSNMNEPGSYIINKIRDINSHLQNQENLSNPIPTEFVKIISSILVDIPKPSVDIRQNLYEFLKKDPKIAKILPNQQISDKLQSVAIVVGRLLLIHKLTSFFKSLANNSKWREENYMVGSLMLSSTFICDIALTISDIEQKHFKGTLTNLKNFTKPIPIETIEGRISLLSHGIVKMQITSDDEQCYEYAYALLIHYICDFFSKDFILPTNVAIRQLRSPWYVFASSLEMQINDCNEITNLVALLKQASNHFAYSPSSLMKVFFLNGLSIGIAWQFILFGAARGSSAKLYKPTAPASNISRVCAVALSIATLRFVNIELNSENVLKYADEFSNMESVY